MPEEKREEYLANKKGDTAPVLVRGMHTKVSEDLLIGGIFSGSATPRIFKGFGKGRDSGHTNRCESEIF